MTALRIFLWLPDVMNVTIELQYVYTAFLHAATNEELYGRPPREFDIENYVT